jgi:hypothetical protein
MRYFEIASGLRLPVYSEEQELLDTIPKNKTIVDDDLDERQAELARLMVSRGVLSQRTKDGKIHYRPNAAEDIWRDR